MENGSYTPGQLIDSVVSNPPVDGLMPSDVFIFMIAHEADSIPVWGTAKGERDRLLREFWPDEPGLASTMYGVSSRYATYGWSLWGPARQIQAYRRILHQSEHGEGWIALISKVVQDYHGQDNAGFIETRRAEDRPDSPVIQLNHLDSARCRRTGNWKVPVRYIDDEGTPHDLKYYQVKDLSQMPSADRRMRGYQLCAVSRCLREAQIMRDIAIFKREELTGLNPKKLHLIGGVPQTRIEDAIKLARIAAVNEGKIRHMSPVIAAAIKPEAGVSHEEVNLAGLPDGYDEEITRKWWAQVRAEAFGIDYQDIAPLPGGNLGTAQQSQVLAQKARGKGPAQFMRSVEHIMNFLGIMPATITFKFGEQDSAEDELRTMLQWRRWQMYKLAFDMQLDPRVIHQLMRDNGDLRDEYLAMLGEEDMTPGTEVHSTYKELGRFARTNSRLEIAAKQFAVDLKLVKSLAFGGDIDVVFN